MKKNVSFTLLNRLWLFGIIFYLTGITIPAFAQISGKVFRDFDGDGMLSASVPTMTGARSTSAPIENGVGGVTVRAYVEFNTVPISTATAPDGSFSFSAGLIAAGQRVRLEFSNWQVGFYPSAHNPLGGGTSIQFLTTPATNVNLGVNYPNDYCQSTNVQVIIPCFTNGDPLKTEDNGVPIEIAYQAGTTDALVGFDYDAFTVKGVGNEAANASQFPASDYALTGQTGSVWGIALQRRTKQLFSAAVVKRHAGFGPLGLDGIYVTDLTSTSANATTSFLSLSADLGISAGSMPDRNLLGNKLLANSDPGSMTALGRIGLGGTDMSEDDKTLYVVNLFDRKVYGIEVGIPAQKPSSATGIKSWALTGPGCPQGEFRPWALKVYRGMVYVGGVCSGEYANNQTPVANMSTLPDAVASNSVLSGHIYQLDPNLPGAQFQSVLSFPLSFKRGSADLTNACADFNYWLPWTNTFPEACNANFVLWPQPLLTDIEFDVDGHMIIGMLDRFGHLSGVANHDPNGNGFYDGFTGGDLLRAAPATGIQFDLERNGRVGNLTTQNGIGNGQGPDGGEFYSDDSWMFQGKVAHDEINNGALTLIPGKGEIISSAYDPIDEIYKSGGWRVHSNINGTALRGFVVLIDEPGTFGKASGLGDSKPICDPAPVEIGNRVWYDDNRNGIQDVYEPGIDGLTIRLYDGNTLVASTTSSNGGHWYFNNANVPGGLKFKYRYQVRMDMSQLVAYNLTAKRASAAAGARLQTTKAGGRLAAREYFISPFQVPNGPGGTFRDSDGLLVDGEVVIDVITGDMGQNDQNYDYSVQGCPVIEAQTKQLSVCQGETIPDITVKGLYFAINDQVKFVCFDTPQTDPAAVYSATNVLGVVTPSASSTAADGGLLVTLVRPTIPTNTNSTATRFKYVYAIVESIFALPVGCAPLDEIVIVIKPAPKLSVTSATLTCAQTSVTLTSTLTDAQNQPIANGVYRWTGPNNFTSSAQNAVVTSAGTYTLNAAAPDCPTTFSMVTATVQSFTTAPVIVDAIGGFPACSTCTTTISVTVTPANAAIRWTGPNSFSSNLATPTVSTPGFYTVVATGPNGCKASAEVEVQPRASIGDFVFYDRDNNGVQSGSSETGVSGVTVELYASGGATPINSLTTGPSGLYSFTALTPGCYQVKFVPGSYPTDFVATTATVGSNGAIDSDANPQTGLTPVVCLSAGENNKTVDAGLVEKSLRLEVKSICIKDTPYISYTITALNFVPTTGATITVMKFADNSIVETKVNQPFTGQFLYAGAKVDAQGNPVDWPGWDFDAVKGWFQVDDGLRPFLKIAVSVNPTTEASVDYPGPTPACIPGPPMGLGDRVWKDDNKNGLQDSGELGVSNVRVELYEVISGVRATTVLSTTTTDGLGNYLFRGLYEGSYQVRFVPSTIPANCSITQPFAGTDRANDSNANVVTGFTDVITLSLTDLVRPNLTVDCGLAPLPGFNFDPCPVLLAASLVNVCAGEAMPPLSVSITATGSYTASQVRFVYYETQQSTSNTALYSGGGTPLGTIAPTAGVATLTNAAVPTTNSGSQTILRYVYAVLNPTPTDPVCRPVAEFIINVKSKGCIPLTVRRIR